VVEEPWKDWFFYNQILLFALNTNDTYYQLVDDGGSDASDADDADDGDG
jgi:hypothetical protein